MLHEKPLQELVVEAITTRDLQLPVFNPVALELQKALHDERIKITEIEEMIVADQSLASQILRMANAAFFKGMQKIVTIRKAILRLGIQQVTNLAMVVLQRNAYVTKSKIMNQYMEKLWQHALASALGGQWIAENSGYRDESDTAFLAGLLHNIGQLAILKILEDVCAQRGGSTDLSNALILEIITSDMHTAQGYMLMQKWNLPEEYGVIVRDHHKEPLDAGNYLLVITRLVDQACEKVGIGLYHDPNIVLAASEEAQLLGLTEVQLAELEIMLEDSLRLQV